jgi:hypothetical protein
VVQAFKEIRAEIFPPLSPEDAAFRRAVVSMGVATVGTLNALFPLKGLPPIYHESMVALAIIGPLNAGRELLSSVKTEEVPLEKRVLMAETAISALLLGNSARGQLDRGARQTVRSARYARAKLIPAH